MAEVPASRGGLDSGREKFTRPPVAGLEGAVRRPVWLRARGPRESLGGRHGLRSWHKKATAEIPENHSNSEAETAFLALSGEKSCRSAES